MIKSERSTLSSGVGSSVQGGGVQEYNLYNTSDPKNTIDYGSMFSVGVMCSVSVWWYE